MTEIVIKVNGVGSVNAKLRGAVERSKNLTTPMKVGAQLMLGSVDRNFRSSGRPAQWVPLSPAYARRKLSQGYSSKPLIRTGIMKASIAPKIDSHSFRVGTSLSYARYHQFGTSRMPKREFVLFQAGDIRDINKIVLEYIKGA